MSDVKKTAKKTEAKPEDTADEPFPTTADLNPAFTTVDDGADDKDD